MTSCRGIIKVHFHRFFIGSGARVAEGGVKVALKDESHAKSRAFEEW